MMLGELASMCTQAADLIDPENLLYDASLPDDMCQTACATAVGFLNRPAECAPVFDEVFAGVRIIDANSGCAQPRRPVATVPSLTPVPARATRRNQRAIELLELVMVCDTVRLEPPAEANAPAATSTHVSHARELSSLKSEMYGPGADEDSVAMSWASFSIRTRDRFGNARTTGGQKDEMTFDPRRTKELALFWSDFCESGVQCPEIYEIYDHANGTYTLDFFLTPAMHYDLAVLFNETAHMLLDCVTLEYSGEPEDDDQIRVAGAVCASVCGDLDLDDSAPWCYTTYDDDGPWGYCACEAAHAVPNPMVPNSGAMLANGERSYDMSYQYAPLTAGHEISGRAHTIEKLKLPAPLIAYSQLEDSLIRIRVSFSADTNMARMDQYSRCSDLFGRIFLSVLGENPVCVWMDRRTLAVALGANSQALTTNAALTDQAAGADFGDWDLMLSFKPDNELLGFYENTFGVVGAVNISDPTDPISPVAVLEGPTEVGLCDPAQLHGTLSYGGGPRQLRYYWELLDNADDLMTAENENTTLGDYVHSMNDGLDTGSNNGGLYFSNTDLQPGKNYRVKLTVFNMLYIADSAVFTMAKRDVKIPKITMNSPYQNMFVTDQSILSVVADIPMSKCKCANCECPGDCYIPASWTEVEFRWGVHSVLAPRPPACATDEEKEVLLHELGEMCEFAQGLVDAGRAAGLCGSSCAAAVQFVARAEHCGAGLLAGDAVFLDVLQCDAAALPAVTPPAMPELDETTQARKDLFFPGAALATHYAYKIQQVAWLRRNPADQSAVFAEVTMRATALVATIAGGTQVVGSDMVNRIDGALSRDPSAVDAELYFEWSCYMPAYPPQAVAATGGLTEGPCLDAQNETLALPPMATITLAPGTFLTTEDGALHVIDLTVSKYAFINGIVDIRQASTSADFYAVPGEPPSVMIASLKYPKVSPSDRLKLTSEVQSFVEGAADGAAGMDSIKWFVLEGQMDLNDFAVSTTGRNAPNLVINGAALVPGQLYRFRLVVRDMNGKGFAEIPVLVNQAPSSGSFGVAPSEGFAVQTEFVFYTNAPSLGPWADDPDDMPLRYQFGYSKGGRDFILGQLQTSPNRTVQLPIADEVCMLLKGLGCPVSKLVKSDACPRPRQVLHAKDFDYCVSMCKRDIEQRAAAGGGGNRTRRSLAEQTWANTTGNTSEVNITARYNATRTGDAAGEAAVLPGEGAPPARAARRLICPLSDPRRLLRRRPPFLGADRTRPRRCGRPRRAIPLGPAGPRARTRAHAAARRSIRGDGLGRAGLQRERALPALPRREQVRRALLPD
jgi:hypothetical protein